MSTASDHVDALARHFIDLRDGTHGGAVARQEKAARFAEEARLLGPVARQVLDEINERLLLAAGTITETGVCYSGDGGVEAIWSLSWPEQRNAKVPPIMLHAYYYGAYFHHPHLRRNGRRLAAERLQRGRRPITGANPESDRDRRSAQPRLSSRLPHRAGHLPERRRRRLILVEPTGTR